MDALKIFKGIERCRQGACSDCPYEKDGDVPDCMYSLKEELFALFIEQSSSRQVKR